MKNSFSANAILDFFYPQDTPLKRLLLKHSRQVRDKALEILAHAPEAARQLDEALVSDGALLHDLGICQCHAPGILCTGEQPYIQHGLRGGEMLRAYGRDHGLDLEPYARICERHTGAGLSAQEIRQQHLPLPERDFLPETLEEKLICLADKYYSKSGDMQEKSLSNIRHALARFGEDTLRRFDDLCTLFGCSASRR